MDDDRDRLCRALAALRLQLQSDLAFGIEELPGTRGAAGAASVPARAPSAPPPPSPRSAGAPPPYRPAPPTHAFAPPRAPPPPARPLLVPPLERQLGAPEKVAALAQLAAEIATCSLCRLGSARTLAVPGEGNADAELVFIGEGPGADEDRSGRPFVGPAGELLTRIVKAMGFSRETVYICNIVKCRPPGNRVPQKDEADACAPWLRKQLAILSPKVICTLGAPATRALLGVTTGITALRGKLLQWSGIPVVPTFHPAYLLRTPEDKPLVWQDVQLVARILVEKGGTVPNPPATPRK
jgi:DNA polymerase